MVIVRERLPIACHLTLLVHRARRRVHHQMVGRRNFFQAAQDSSEQCRQLTAVGAWPGLLESVVVPPVQQPDLVWHARSIRAQRIIIALYVHDALSLFFFLPHHVAEKDRKSTRLNSSHGYISYAVFCLKKKK